jgi:hypothetical protein
VKVGGVHIRLVFNVALTAKYKHKFLYIHITNFVISLYIHVGVSWQDAAVYEIKGNSVFRHSCHACLE